MDAVIKVSVGFVFTPVFKRKDGDALFGWGQCRPHAIAGKHCDASDDYCEREQCCYHRCPAHSRAVLLEGLELLWQLRVAHFVRIEVRDRDTHSVFYFACPKVVQERSPLFVLFEILGDMLRKKNVPGVAAIHHPLRDIDSGPGKIRTIIHVDYAAHWSAMNSHAKLQARMLF